MAIVKRFIQIAKMSIQDFKAKKEVNALRLPKTWAISSVG